MSAVQLNEAELKKLGEMVKDEAFARKLFELETAEEVKSELHAKGVDLSLDEINELARQMNEKAEKLKDGGDELTEEELEEAAGGVTPIVAYTLSVAATITYFAVTRRW